MAAMDKGQSALFAACLAAVSTSIQTWRILADRGLLPPNELDEMVHGLTVPFEALADNEVARTISATIRAHLDPELSKIYQTAQRTWPKPPA